ncbi:MAG: Ppx/GppA phosphatase family protein [Sporolactobacillus sp.]
MDIVQKHAVIDIGSNSIRLVVIGIDQKFFSKELLNFKVVARLSNYIDNEQKLNEDGEAKLVQVLERFLAIIRRETHITAVDAVATAAMRKARNREDVFERIFQRTGLRIRLLSGLKEAYYGYVAVINSMDVSDGISIDIGGGSTEVTQFRNRELVQCHSFPFGAVTLYQTYFASGDRQAVDRLETYLKQMFEPFEWLTKQSLPVIGIGGAARNLCKIDQAERHYPMSGLHQYIMPGDRLNNLTVRLATMNESEREVVQGLSKDRADIIVPAAVVINMLVKINRGKQFILSGEGLREGIFYEWMLHRRGEVRIPYVLRESIRYLRRNFNLDSAHAGYVKKLAFQLFEGLSPLIADPIPAASTAWLLSHSADLAYIGEYINNESSSAHTFYLLTNIKINGISHHQRLAVALIASFKNREKLCDFAAPFAKFFGKDELRMYELLGAILRLAHDFDQTRQQVVSEVNVRIVKKKNVHIHASYHDDAYFEEQAVLKHKKHLERCLQLPIDVMFRQQKD